LRPRIDHARDALARARQHYAEASATPMQGPAIRVHHLHGNSRLPSGEVPLPSFVPAGEERDRWLAHAAGEMGAAEAELNRLLELERELASISRALAELHRNIRSWLAEAAKLPRNLVQAGPSKMEVPAGDLPTVVEALRSELAAIQEQLAAVAAAPYPASDAKCAAAGLVDRLAAAGAPDCARAVGTGGEPALGRVTYPVVGTAPLFIENVAGLCVWALRDLIVDKINQAIDAAAGGDAGALDQATRDRETLRLKAESLRIERVEAAAIEQAEAAGQTISHRVNVDPRAYLGLSDETAPQ